ncbi:uncharacterized protein TM35_000081930 [Trypanosoma theileri]|uniref:Transmembrane protein n=1 Tax=Trypanosoma theileri TaxID=67003 RepID=A0A1X0P0F4_9TRYP|nr:uncharacterized protein TM35_000081930 [Trypanosoma theileri]ORC90395.1 hypothetical protein TM35_000081930 [Trypanosoma theileri]
MRVRAYHHHTVSRSSAALAALVIVNAAFMFCFALPVVLAFPWSRVLTATQQAWGAALISIWAIAEIPRLYAGHTGNNLQHVPALMRFALMTLVPQIPLVIVYMVMWPQRNALNEAVSITMIILLVAELFCTIRLLVTLMQRNRIDFFIFYRRNFIENRRFS